MYDQLTEELKKSNTTLVAVSKTKPISDILSLYEKGQRVFGENRVQELTEKNGSLPKDIQWHMIGMLQKNKVKYIAPFIACIHSVDSLPLAKVINKEAAKNDRIIDVLLQIKIAQEETKSGYDFNKLRDELSEIITLKNLHITGVMGIGTWTSEESVTKTEFKNLVEYFNELKTDFFSTSSHFKEISMGMSGDYQLAIEMGSTMVRIGSLLFGARY